MLPRDLRFEFEMATDGKVIKGKVPADFDEVDRLNGLLSKPIRIKVLETCVGKGQVRYRLLEAPTGGQA